MWGQTSNLHAKSSDGTEKGGRSKLIYVMSGSITNNVVPKGNIIVLSVGLFILTAGYIFTMGCSADQIKDAGIKDGGDANVYSDAGLTGDGGDDASGVDASFDASDGGGGASCDSGPVDDSGCPPCAICYKPILYDYDAGTIPENPLGPEFIYAGTSGSWRMTRDGYLIFNAPTSELSLDYFIDGSVCFQKLGSWTTKCLNPSDYNIPLAKYAGPDYLFSTKGRLGWQLHYYFGSKESGALFYYDVMRDLVVKAASCINCQLWGKGGNEDVLIYEYCFSKECHLMKFNYLDGNKTALNTNAYVGVIQDLFIDGQDVVMHPYNDYGWKIYNLATDQQKDLLLSENDFIYSFKYYRLFYSDGTYVDPNLYLYNILNDSEEILYSYSRTAVIQGDICSENIFIWRESIEGDAGRQKIILYDKDEKTSRYLVDKIGTYGVRCDGKYAIITPDATGGTEYRNYIIDMEKAGFLANGHLVPLKK